MKTILTYLMIICVFFVWSCKQSSNSEQNEIDNTDSTNTTQSIESTDEDDVSAFILKIAPSQSLDENQIMSLIANQYPNRPSDCQCGDDKNCYDRKLMTTHFFKEKGVEKAIVIIGNSCDDAAHAESGWCDAAIMHYKDEKWQLDNFQKEIGGGGTFGAAGDIGDIFQIGEEAIGIEVGFGDVAFGALYEGVNILAYHEGYIQSVANIQTLVDNSAAGDDFAVCNCVKYDFKARETTMYDLQLTKVDCSENKNGNCEGKAVETATIINQKGLYTIPKDFEIF